MINTFKILNAINEGIKSGFKLSSNSAIDNSLYVDFSDSKINDVESFNIGKIEKLDFVDLGLSVKWAKCNIGATCQDTPKSWYGSYYAWGELESKQVYSKKSYDLTLYKKYDKDAFHVLLSEDNVITLTYYGLDKFRMPTKEEMEELLDETKIKSEWKTDYHGIKGLNGREFISLKNGNSIFIPTAGAIDNNTLYDDDFLCNLWSSSLNSDIAISAHVLEFSSINIDFDTFLRYYGFSVRGVCS